MTYMATPNIRNQALGVMKLTIFGKPFLVHHYFIVSLSNLCLGEEKKIFKEIMHFHYMTCGHTLAH